MPLNQPRQGAYTPTPTGAVKLITRSARRARLYSAGSFFRSNDRGVAANLIKIGVFKDFSQPAPEGICVIHNTSIKSDEQIFAVGMSAPTIQLLKFDLEFDQVLKISYTGNRWGASLIGIRWQIAPGSPPAPIDLGEITEGLFASTGILLKVTNIASWPTAATIELRPRTRRYTLVTRVVVDPDTMQSTTGWDPNALRATLNADAGGFVRMPFRNSAPNLPIPDGEDKQDFGVDDDFIVPAAMTNMAGGDGLPASPVGLNTGPDRVMVHLNYAERDDGSLNELNQVFEWVGDTASDGSWQRYT